ncbi:restriction endonuclease subunit S [Metamycoplasma gateae]|uniref:Restriction endonuclease subunit S n=1 Tax=Metamycoplasma gateae TaxID=35769 RepID=A0ABZ2AGW1_9BACT|nr:restriction endonuclease subunit S [Metamycoplasma gateae]
MTSDIKQYKLSDIFNIFGGFTPPKSNTENWKDGTIPWFRLEDIRLNGRILDDSIKKVKKARKIFPKNSIILSTTATIGEHALITTDFICNQRFTVFSLKDEFENIISIKFLYYLFFRIGSFLKETRSVDNFSLIRIEELKKISISIPPVEKQNEIVNILDKFTELETELETELDLRNLQYDYYLNSLLDFSNNEMLLKNIMNLNSKEKLDTNVKKINLTDICDISRGLNYTKDYILKNKGDYPVYSSQTSNEGIIGFINKYDYDGEYITWTTDGNAGTVFYRNGKFSATNHCGVLKVKNDNYVNSKFLFYLLKKVMPEYVIKATLMPVLLLNTVKEITVSIPSIEIQNKIANILDKLETYTKDIKTGLPLEIKQRKEQFDYYHKMLLTFDDNLERERERELSSSFIELLNMLEWKLMLDLTEYKLPDIFEISRGKIYSKSYILNNQGEFPVYSSQTLNDGILGKINTYDYDGEYITWNTDGYAGTVFYRNNKFSITNICGILKLKNPKVMNIKYLSYLLKITFPKFVNKSTSNSNKKMGINLVKNIKILIPSIRIQNKIVETLDKLEIYAKDIKDGLPKEINLRKKQYKYYLNKLLDFKK